MDMIDVATNDLEALAWQISPLFVVLSLVLSGFSFYVMPYIAQKLEGLATSRPKQHFVWSVGASLLIAFNIWVVNLLLLLGIKLIPFNFNYFFIIPFIALFISYFLYFYFLNSQKNIIVYNVLWTLINSASLLFVNFSMILSTVESQYFEVNYYKILLSSVMTLGIGFLVLALLNTKNNHTNYFKNSAYALSISILIIISYRINLSSIDFFNYPPLLSNQQVFEKIAFAIISSVFATLLSLLFLGLLFAYHKIKAQAQELIKLRDVTHKLSGDHSSLEQLAHYDSLTGLFNRHAFMDAFTARLNEAKQGANKLGVLFIDLDNFKLINDTLGHSAGDELLRIVSRRLRSVLRNHDLIGRIGGDEFCLITPITSLPEAKVIANRVLHKMQEPITISGQVANTTISIGISLFPYDGDSQDILIKNADNALYQSKGSGRNTISFYSDYLQHKSHRELRLQKDLHIAITQSQLFIQYQPVVRLSDKKIISLEALVRWQHPEKGILTPESFINIAEFNGFVELVDKWVIKKICKDIKLLHQNNTPLLVTMNCSALNMSNDHFITDTLEILENENIDPQWFCFELSENILYEYRHKAPIFLSKLNLSGLKLIVDDFGSGASSLMWLKTLPITEIKLDRCLLLDPHNPEETVIISALIAMSHQLDWKVTAKGVEMLEQTELLIKEQCDYVQGYAFGKPARLEDILPLLA
ncbi:MAG: EAL domain-containing protein [Moraxellaceae bacterium]|nr:EAL domain-containing protein [Moraxellaceae bacterium]